ncbi:MAG: hypothetical protein HZB45_22990 [Mycolicibacterium rufum]|nr:hypothetical protein [Mycolicibacterium rufum]
MDAYDPSKDAEETVRYDDIDLDRYLFAYYLPFLRAIGFGDRTGDVGDPHDVEAVSFGSLGLNMGLLRPIADLTREYEGRSDLGGYAERVRAILDEESAFPVAGTIFPDGSILATKWTEAIQGSDIWTER